MRFALLLAFVAGFAAWSAPARAAPERIGVVDMVELITNHPRFDELRRKLDQRQSEAETYAKQEQRALLDLQAAIELMPRNSPQRRSREKELLTQQTMLKFELQWRKDTALREYMKGLTDLYVSIHGKVADYARTNGLQIVLLKTDPQIQAADFNDYYAKIRLRGVVYSDPTLDITPMIRAQFMPRPPQPGSQPPAKRGSGSQPAGSPSGTRPDR